MTGRDSRAGPLHLSDRRRHSPDGVGKGSSRERQQIPFWRVASLRAQLSSTFQSLEAEFKKEERPNGSTATNSTHASPSGADFPETKPLTSPVLRQIGGDL